MVAVLALAFLAVPFVELFLIVKVAGEFGIATTLLALLVISVVGAWLCRREGLAVLRRIQKALGRGELPHAQVVDGGLILLAGALLLTPGFLTDVFGVLLLLPPTRIVIRRALLARFRHRISTYRVASTGGVYDVWGTETGSGRPSTPAPPIDRR